LVLAGALFFLMGHGALAWAEEQIPSGIAALLVASLPYCMVFVEKVTNRDTHISPKTITGLIIGITAIVLLVAPQKSFAGKDIDPLRAITLLGGVFAWATASVYSRSAKLPDSPLVTAGAALLFGGILLVLFGTITGETNRLAITEISLLSIVSFVYLIIFGSIIAFTSYIWLLSVTTAARVSTYAFVNPVIAVLFGWFIGGEVMNLNIIIVTVMIVASIYLILSEKVTKRINST